MYRIELKNLQTMTNDVLALEYLDILRPIIIAVIFSVSRSGARRAPHLVESLAFWLHTKISHSSGVSTSHSM